jgi:hypothetical protein
MGKFWPIPKVDLWGSDRLQMLFELSPGRSIALTLKSSPVGRGTWKNCLFSDPLLHWEKGLGDEGLL